LPAAATPAPPDTVVRPENPTSNPIASPDAATTQKGVPVAIDPFLNDAASAGSTVDPASVQFYNPTTGSWVSKLTIPGEGTYTSDPSTGKVTFTPVASFIGTATPIAYRFADVSGKTATSTITVRIVSTPPPYANPDYAFGPKGKPVVLDAPANDATGTSAMNPSTMKLKDPKTGAWTTTVVIAGQGTYSVDTTTGRVTFTPLPAFTGIATPVTYAAMTQSGKRVSSTLHPRILGPTAILSVTTTPSKTVLREGQGVRIVVRGCNKGSGEATDTNLSLTIPAGYTINNANGAKVKNGTATWATGTLAPGACATRVITLVTGNGAGRILTGTIAASNADPASDPAKLRIIRDTTSGLSVVTG
jgi:CshA-type fibril repeat protein